jgi:O-antigen ligase
MLSQGYVAYEMNVFYFDGFNRVHEIGFGGMDNNSVAIAMDTGIGLAFFLGLSERRWWAKLICFGAAMFMAHTVMFAFSRGGMLGLIITTMVAFLLIPREPKHYFIFLIAVLIGVRLAGKEVLDRFASTFADPEQRDTSAQSRIELWAACRDVMAKNPVFGVGPWCFPVVVQEYGFGLGKSGHSLWLQEGAELGIPGMALLLIFYLLCAKRLFKFRHDRPDLDPWLPSTARMIISSLVGFIISAQFVSLEGLELPFYVVLIGAGALKLLSLPEFQHEVVPSLARDRKSMDVSLRWLGMDGWSPPRGGEVIR